MLNLNLLTIVSSSIVNSFLKQIVLSFKLDNFSRLNLKYFVSNG